MSAVEFIDLSQPEPVSTLDFRLADKFGVSYRSQYKCWAITDPNGWLKFNLSMPNYRSGGANFVLRLCSATVNGVSDCPVEIKVNGNLIVSQFDPKIDTFYTRAWYLTERLLRPGDNEILFSLLNGRTQVFIRRAWVALFTNQRQQKLQWCWAAVSDNVVRYYYPGSSWSQEKVVSDTWANKLKGLSDLDNVEDKMTAWMIKAAKNINQFENVKAGKYDSIDIPFFAHLGLRTVGGLKTWDQPQPEMTPDRQKLYGDDILWRPLTFSELQEEANNMRPVIARIQWKSNGLGHFIVISGVSEAWGKDEQMVAVQDPDGGVYKYVKYEVLRDSYDGGQGRWQYTVLTGRAGTELTA